MGLQEWMEANRLDVEVMASVAVARAFQWGDADLLPDFCQRVQFRKRALRLIHEALTGIIGPEHREILKLIGYRSTP